MACEVERRLTSFEERFVVVRALNQRRAEQKALELAMSEEQSYKNARGETVAWRFDHFVDVCTLDIDEFSDGTWLYRRAYPRLSRLAQRSKDSLQVVTDEAVQSNHTGGWYGAMLLFRVITGPPHDEERLVLIRSDGWKKAARKALALAVSDVSELTEEELVGLFDIFELPARTIESGTEVYSRFYRPSDLKDKNRPPRETHLTLPEFVSAEQRQVRASA